MKQKEFEDIKTIVDEEIVFFIPIFTVPFDWHTDASDFQIRLLPYNYQKPTTLFYTKLIDTKKWCTTKMKELIIIVDTLK